MVGGVDEGVVIKQHADQVGMPHQRGNVQGRAALAVAREHGHCGRRVMPLGRRRARRTVVQRMPRAAIATTLTTPVKKKKTKKQRKT